MPVGFGHAIKTRGRPLSVMAHLKKSIVEVKATDNCLTHALVIAIARVDNDSNYKSYHDGWKIRPVVKNLLETTDIDLINGAGIPELTTFQEQFREYKIVVYQVLSCDSIMFEGHVESSKRLNQLYDVVGRHYHGITKQTGATARQYVCKACNKDCRSDSTQSAIRCVVTA